MGNALSCCSFCHDHPDTFPRGGTDTTYPGYPVDVRSGSGRRHRHRHRHRSRSESTSGSSSSSSNSHSHSESYDEYGNCVPLKKVAITWTTPVPLTAEALEKRRREFWETAPSYGGTAEVWDALRAAVEIGKDDLDTARAILKCAGITLPRGLLTECYDERGFRYGIPTFCLADPINMNQSAEGPNVDKSRLPATLSKSTTTSTFGAGVSSEQERNAQAVTCFRVRLSDGRDVRIPIEDDGQNIVKIEQLKDCIIKAACLSIHRDELLILWQGNGPLGDDVIIEQLDIPKSIVIQAWIHTKRASRP